MEVLEAARAVVEAAAVEVLEAARAVVEAARAVMGVWEAMRARNRCREVPDEDPLSRKGTVVVEAAVVEKGGVDRACPSCAPPLSGACLAAGLHF